MAQSTTMCPRRAPPPAFGLRTRDGLERTLVALAVPDLGVIPALPARPHGQNDQVEDRPPLPARHLDDARVGEELLEVAAHRPIAGGVGRAEVQEQHADAAASPPGGRRQACARVRLRAAIAPRCPGGPAGMAANAASPRSAHVGPVRHAGATDADVGEPAPRHVLRAGRCCAGRRGSGASGAP